MSLSGKTILLTRDPGESSGFIAEASRRGARVLPFQTIRITGPETWEACDREIARLHHYRAIAFTSAQGVRHFVGRCEEKGVGVRTFQRMAVFAVGQKTREEIEQHGIKVRIVPAIYSARALAEMLQGTDLHGMRILLPQGNLAREELAVRLEELGATVTAVTVYRTVATGTEEMEAVWQEIEGGRVHVVVFASPSAVRNFFSLFPPDKVRLLASPPRMAAIGPTTGGAVEEVGWHADIMAKESTLLGLLDAIDSYYAVVV